MYKYQSHSVFQIKSSSSVGTTSYPENSVHLANPGSENMSEVALLAPIYRTVCKDADEATSPLRNVRDALNCATTTHLLLKLTLMGVVPLYTTYRVPIEL